MYSFGPPGRFNRFSCLPHVIAPRKERQVLHDGRHTLNSSDTPQVFELATFAVHISYAALARSLVFSAASSRSHSGVACSDGTSERA